MPVAFGISLSSASSSAPEPVPMSSMRKRLAAASRRAERASSAASTTVSVSGRGTSTSGVRPSGRLQNSLRPRMRATGSRLSRRAASGKTAVDLARLEQAVALRHQLRRGRGCSACASRMRASASAYSMPSSAEVSRQQPQRLGDRGAGLQPRNDASPRALGRQQFGLMLRHQRVDHFVRAPRLPSSAAICEA